MTDAEAAAYLAAFIDGEGHIGCHMTARHRATKTIEFSNTDKQLFDRACALGAQIGLEFRVYFQKSKREGWSDKWIAYLRGGADAFRRFQKVVPLQCERKIAALQELVDSYASPEHIEAIYASRRTSIEQLCPVCGNRYFVFPADLKRGHGKYCSRSCGAKARAVPYPVACATCGDTFFVNKARKDTAKFCSTHCSGVANTDRLRSQASIAAKARWHPD